MPGGGSRLNFSFGKKFPVVFFFFTAALLLFWNAGRIPLFEPDEGRYADIALTMMKTGDWLIPRMNHLVHLHKPPLSSWLVVTTFKLLGPSEFSARLPNILLSLATLFVLMRLGNGLFENDPRPTTHNSRLAGPGLYSAWILLTAPLYLAVSRIVTPDMLLCFLNLVAIGSIARIFFGERNKVKYFYIASIATGLGMLTKGPVAWMMSLLPALVFVIWKKKKLGIPAKHWIFGTLLMLALSFSWFLMIAVEKPGSLSYFLQAQLLGRIKGGTGHRHPIFYYLTVAPLGFLPWTLFLPTAFTRGSAKSGEPREVRDKIQFLFLGFLVPFIFFSLFKSKLATYIVPLFPPLALITGYFWRQFNLKKIPLTRPVAVSSWLLDVVYLLIPIAGLIFVKLRPEFIGGIQPFALFCGGGTMILAWVVMTTVLVKKKWEWVFPVEAAVGFALCFLTLTFLPAIQYKNAKVFAEKIEEIRRPGDEVLMYYRYFPSLPFYLRERVITVGAGLETATFEKDPLLAKYVIGGQEGIKSFVEGKERILALTNEEGFERAKSFTRNPLYVILKQQGFILFSNRPFP